MDILEVKTKVPKNSKFFVGKIFVGMVDSDKVSYDMLKK